MFTVLYLPIHNADFSCQPLTAGYRSGLIKIAFYRLYISYTDSENNFKYNILWGSGIVKYVYISNKYWKR